MAILGRHTFPSNMIASVFRQNLINFCYPNRLKSYNLFYPLSLLHFSTISKFQFQPAVYEFLVHKHHFSPESASEVASAVTRFSNPERSDSVLSFFKENGFSISQLERTVKAWPQLLSADLEKTIKPKFDFFQGLGVSTSEITRIISVHPRILGHSVSNRLIPSFLNLTSLFTPDEVVKFPKFGWFLKANLETSLIPNVELLKKCGLSMDQIIRLMSRHPRTMLYKPKDVKKFMDRAEAMGVSRSSNNFLNAIRYCSMSDESWELKLRTLREMGLSDVDIKCVFMRSPFVFGLKVETWKLKINNLRKMGFSDSDVRRTLSKSPTLFHLMEERINKVKEFLLATGKYGLSCIVRSPRSLLFSIEKRYKPRVQVLELLEAKNLLRKWPALSTLCHMTDKKFHSKYVAPYFDEIGDSYVVKNDK